MVRPDSHRIPRVPWYLGTLSGGRSPFAYGAVTRSGRPFHASSASDPICNSVRNLQLPLIGPTTPRLQRLQPVTQPRFGHPPLSLATTHGILFFSSRYLDVSVPSVSSLRPMYSVGRTRALPRVGFPIRISPDQCLLAAPRSVSSPATSFIGSWRQGIHRTPLVA